MSDKGHIMITNDRYNDIGLTEDEIADSRMKIYIRFDSECQAVLNKVNQNLEEIIQRLQSNAELLSKFLERGLKLV